MSETRDPQAKGRDGVVHLFDLFIAFFGGNAVGAVLGIAAAVVVLLVAMASGYHPTQQGLTEALQNNFAIFQLLLAMGEVGLIGGIVLVAHWRFERPLTHFFGPASILSILLAALSGAILSAAINGGNAWLQSAHWIDVPETQIDRMMIPHGLRQYAIALSVIAILAPFAEEYFFRGLFFSWMRARAGIWTTILVTSLVFALVHGQPLMHPGFGGWVLTVQLFFSGILMGWWVARTGSARTSFAAHAAFNAAALALPLVLP